MGLASRKLAQSLAQAWWGRVADVTLEFLSTTLTRERHFTPMRIVCAGPRAGGRP